MAERDLASGTREYVEAQGNDTVDPCEGEVLYPVMAGDEWKKEQGHEEKAVPGHVSLVREKL